MTDRLKSFKNKGRDDEAEFRRRRTEVTVELRRNKRDEHLQKRRNVPDDYQGDHHSDVPSGSYDFSFTDAGISDVRDKLRGLVVNAQSEDPVTKLQAVRSARKILSKDKNPPIDELIISGIVPVLVSCVCYKAFDGSWLCCAFLRCLHCVAMTTQTSNLKPLGRSQTSQVAHRNRHEWWCNVAQYHSSSSCSHVQCSTSVNKRCGPSVT